MSIEAFLVLLFVISPGLIADSFYRFLLWRPEPKESQKITRAILFSVISLFLLILSSTIFSELTPLYLTPTWWNQSWNGEYSSLITVLVPWVMHIILAWFLAVLFGLVMKFKVFHKIVNKIFKQSLYSTAWEEFAQLNIGKWVFVKLVDGRHYYGGLGIVSGDQSLNIVLWKPYPYNDDEKIYEITSMKQIFIPASQIASIVVSYSSDEIENLNLKSYYGKYSIERGVKIDDQTKSPKPTVKRAKSSSTSRKKKSNKST